MVAMRKPKVNRFLQELQRYGPMAPPAPPMSPRRARAYCHRLARRHYENFTVASRILPGRLRQHFYNIYAYCRWADDLADETGDPHQALALLGWWERHLRDCYEGRATHPVFIALADTIKRFEIPSAPFVDLLVAFRQDQRIRKYDTMDQLLEYCRYSANPVGRLVLYLGRCHDDQRALLSDSISTGLQLVNFWQDVARDFDKGRIYLPQVDCHRFGYDMTHFKNRECNEAFRRLMAYEVEGARGWLRRGLPLIPMMPPDLQFDVTLFIHGGLVIADEIARQDFDVWNKRPTISGRKRLHLALSCWWRLKRGAFRGGKTP
jgi:squalene synthase HpnC